MWWNFVGRSHEEIAAYRAAYQAEMGFEAPDPQSPLSHAAHAASSSVERASQADGAEQEVDVEEGALGEPVSGTLRDELVAPSTSTAGLSLSSATFPGSASSAAGAEPAEYADEAARLITCPQGYPQLGANYTRVVLHTVDKACG